MKPEEGFAVAALGLGKYVVEGEKSYRFSPKYPTTAITSIEDQVRDSQVKFFAVNLKNQNPDLYTEKGMGNGLIKNIRDVIYVDNKLFDKSKTEEMALEIALLNDDMVKAGKQYVLIGPGRWGTRDKWIGIPVDWPQISNAKVIVETSLEGYPLDASSGSHFFHNLTSANVGYFSVQPEKSGSFITYKKLDEQELIQKTKFFHHVRFKKPIKIRMDGKKRISVVTVK
jgi:hypothetical protein